MNKNTGAQRMADALGGGKPDRVPVVPKIWVDFSAKFLDIDISEVICEPFMAMDVIFETADMLGLDATRAFFFPKRKAQWHEKTLFEVDEYGKTMGRIDVGGGLATVLEGENQSVIDIEDPYYIAFSQFYKRKEPFVKTMDEARRICVPDKNYYKSNGYGDMLKKIIAKSHDMAVIGDCGSVSLSHLVYMMGMERAMYTIMDEPHLAYAIFDKGIQIAVEKGKACIDSGIRILRLNDSTGNMSVISPSMWREFVLPSFSEVCAQLKKYCPEVFIYCHICGNVFPVVEDLAGSGLDCIGPMDPLGGHSAAQYRNKVGEGFCLMGGVDTMTLLKKTEQQVYDESMLCIKQAGKNGAYVLGSGCAVPRDTPSGNIKAMVKASKDYQSM